MATKAAWLVTIKLPRNPNHDPRNKQTGPCPMSSACTDVTGEHHTGLVTSPGAVATLVEQYHITRIELIHLEV